MILELLLGASALLNVVLVVVLVRASRRLLQFDDVFGLLVDDCRTNIKYFDKLLNTPILQNSPEILDAQRNMGVIRDRLNEFVVRMEETSHRENTEGNG